MPTPLTSPGSLALMLGIPSGDASQNALLEQLIDEATQDICDYCDSVDFGLNVYTRIVRGYNTPEMCLPDLPAQGLTLTGNTTANSTTVSGLPTARAPSVSNLFVNQSVSGHGIPANTIITAINTGAGTLTLSNAATATATGVSLVFGIAIWQDNGALGGSAFGAFAATTLLQEGTDYWVDYDFGPGSVCSSGLVYNANGYWFNADVWTLGLIGPVSGPRQGNIKVQYLAGYVTIPASLQGACNTYCAALRQGRKFGRMPSSLGNADMSVSLSAETKIGYFAPEVTSRLARYKKITIPGG